MRRGEVWLCDFGEPVGHEPGSIRPAVMVSADQTAEYGLPVVLPMTRTRRDYGTHIEIELGGEPTYIQCELINVKSSQRLIHKVGELDPLNMIQIETILRRLLKL